ncbi:MAG: hypothetical protein H0U59_05795 [Gemmatimonadaceae bacterium]|nr:hypothetical protein [Gemmatimonadaceae bacterium]
MTGVVLRCPNCGTTQGMTGECEACHEEQVRYFCTRHKPGVWLDKAACSQCGAKFGDPPAAAAPPPRSPPSRTPAPTWTPPGARPTERPPATRERPETGRPREAAGDDSAERRSGRDVFPGARRSGTPTESPPGELWPPSPPRTFEELLDYFLVGRRSTRRAEAPEPRKRETRSERTAARKRPPPVASPAPIDVSLPEIPRPASPRTPGLPIAGCIIRFVIFLALIFALGIGALFMLVGGNAGEFLVDAAQSTGLVSGIPEQTKRGIAAYRAGDIPAAIRDLGQAAVTYPRSGVASLYLARISMDAGDLEQAGDHLKTAVSREPESAIAHRELGRYYLVRSQRSPGNAAGDGFSNTDLMEADRHFAWASNLDPDDRATIGYRACVLAAIGVPAEAESLLAAAGPGPWESCARTAGTGSAPVR